MKREQPKESKVSEKELRQWAERQFHEIDRLMAERTSELPDRQLVESYVERIEINPHEKTGVIVLRGDLKYVHALSSTHVPNGDFMGAHKWCFYSWQESVGVAAEVEIAKELNKPVRYLDSGTLTNVSEGRIGVSK